MTECHKCLKIVNDYKILDAVINNQECRILVCQKCLRTNKHEVKLTSEPVGISGNYIIYNDFVENQHLLNILECYIFMRRVYNQYNNQERPEHITEKYNMIIKALEKFGEKKICL